MKLETIYPYWLIANTEFVLVFVLWLLYAHTEAGIWLVLTGLGALSLVMTVWAWVRDWRRERAFRKCLAAWAAGSPWASAIEAQLDGRLGRDDD